MCQLLFQKQQELNHKLLTGQNTGTEYHLASLRLLIKATPYLLGASLTTLALFTGVSALALGVIALIIGLPLDLGLTMVIALGGYALITHLVGLLLTRWGQSLLRD